MESGGPLACLVLLVGMGDIASKEALDWALGCTDAVKACGEITRLLNDITTVKVLVYNLEIAVLFFYA